MKRTRSLGIWLGKQREKEIFKVCTSHMEKIVRTVEEMRQSIRAYHEGDMEGARALAKAASQTEKEADAIKRSILDELVREIFHPMDRDEILRFVLEADGIASNAKAAAGKLSMIPRKAVADSLTQSLAELSDILVATVEAMGLAFDALVKGAGNVFELCQKVETFEEQVDELRAGLIKDKFIPWCQASNQAGLCIILKEAMDNMEKVADQAEDVADVIRSIAITSG